MFVCIKQTKRIKQTVSEEKPLFRGFFAFRSIGADHFSFSTCSALPSASN